MSNPTMTGGARLSVQTDRPSGGFTRAATLSDWAVGDIRRDLAHRTTGTLRRELAELGATTPPAIRSEIWFYVVGLGLEGCDRALVLEIADGPLADVAGDGAA